MHMVIEMPSLSNYFFEIENSSKLRD